MAKRPDVPPENADREEGSYDSGLDRSYKTGDHDKSTAPHELPSDESDRKKRSEKKDPEPGPVESAPEDDKDSQGTR